MEQTYNMRLVAIGLVVVVSITAVAVFQTPFAILAGAVLAAAASDA